LCLASVSVAAFSADFSGSDSGTGDGSSVPFPGGASSDRKVLSGGVAVVLVATSSLLEHAHRATARASDSIDGFSMAVVHEVVHGRRGNIWTDAGGLEIKRV
jgi:hypothetical protein